jgi:hypothetical protein
MRKLTLELDGLKVESFETGDDALRRGTVRARQDGAATVNEPEPLDSVGCTYFPTCTCTLEGLCCWSITCPPPPPPPKEITAAAAPPVDTV